LTAHLPAADINVIPIMTEPQGAAMNLLQKLVMIALWIAIVINVVVPFPSPWQTILLWTGGFFLIAHTIECVVFSGRVTKAGGNKPAHYIQLLLFGIIHAQTLPK